MNRNVIFLDFDGVLHPPSAIRGARPPLLPAEILAGWPETFQHLHILRLMLKDQDSISVVVSSSWRMFLTDSQLGELLFPIADWYCGSTGNSHLPRDVAIKAWLTANKVEKFVVLDDQLGFFPNATTEWPTLILCNPTLGLSEKRVQSQLKKWMLAL